MHRRLALALSAALLTTIFSGCTAAPAASPTAEEPAGRTPLAVIETAAADPWVGTFDERAAGIASATGVAFGTFGVTGAVSPFGWTDRSLPPGEHAVTVECAGAEVVTVRLSPGEAPSDDASESEIACPGGATLPITTDVVGLSIALDSAGQPGAYLAAIDVAP